MTRLHKVIDDQKIICELRSRVGLLEACADVTYQYSRRTNLRVQRITESGTGEDACAKVPDVINNTMLVLPSLNELHIERCRRLGRQTDLTRPRKMITRFKSERPRVSFYNARGQLKTPKTKEPVQRIRVNEALTKRRSLMAFETRKLQRRYRTAGYRYRSYASNSSNPSPNRTAGITRARHHF